MPRFIKKHAAIKTYENLIKEEYGDGSEKVEQDRFYKIFVANDEKIRGNVAAIFAMGDLITGIKNTAVGEYFSMAEDDYKLVLPAFNDRQEPWPDTNFILQFRDFIQAVRNAPDEEPTIKAVDDIDDDAAA